jgi:hypothetical protein
MASHAQPNGQLIAHRVGNGNLYRKFTAMTITQRTALDRAIERASAHHLHIAGVGTRNSDSATVYAVSSGSVEGLYHLEQLSIRLSRRSVASVHESFVSLPSLWYATCRNSYGYGQSLRVPAVDRITKEKERENTDGPDIARPTGKHGAPDWFLA